MNSVHEPGSRTMSKNLTQEKYRVKTSQKQAKCTECTALGQPARQSCAPNALSRAQRPAARAPRSAAARLRLRLPSVRLSGAPRQPASPPVLARLLAPVSVPPCAPQHARPARTSTLALRAPARAPARPTGGPARPSPRAHACARPSARPSTPAQRLAFLSQYNFVLRHNFVSCSLQYIKCIAIQFQAKAPILQYNFHSSLPCFLQYNFYIAIQIFLFFFFNYYYYYYYYSIISISMKNHQKSLKINFFFHFL